MHIELTEMLRCPEKHQEEFLVLSTVEMSGRMVARGLLGCPVCHKEYEIANGVVEFGGISTHHAPPFSTADPLTVQALLDLSGPGGYVILSVPPSATPWVCPHSWAGSTSWASTRPSTPKSS